jgi:IPT/TIG domain
MSSTTNSIPVDEPNPTGASVPFTIQVGVRYGAIFAAQTTPANSDELSYGPASDAFCSVPTIASISPNVWFAGQTYNVTITGTGFVPDGSSQSCPTSSITVSVGDNASPAVNNVRVVSSTMITASIRACSH